ncbi:postacrosomal sheath WW domain-binding protein isoform X2 [Loxodonta africana]|uniref:postacrosomal sheath WW domain-binding protein isoform X2 n=1 Tax=Loxodonta africana TaxID=9785 RepID=UPI000C812818|nr:postacrosomal sheath WW domain-binding protein isoform X1 [Loxodonta africana]XP_049740496.1 postacrosomal sheath WW domain-binding protein isoform X1 [Elephas maximus indicus]
MAVNQNHTVNRHGAVIPYGESVLKQCKDVVLSFPHQPGESDLFRGTKKGTLFLTSFRVIFLTLHSVSNPMLSFMMPFNLIRDCTVEQPLFAPNYIKGTITAAPGGGWEGQATFKLSFRKGGAIEFSQLMTQAAAAAARGIPFGNVNYWYGGPAMYVVIPGQVNMPCTLENPCQAILYGPTPIRPPPMEYGAPSSVRYETPPLGYGTQPMQHEAPPVGYEAPPSEYGAPPAGYTAPPVGYEAPPPGYEVPSAVYETLPTGNEAPPLRYEAPPPEYGAPSVGYRAQSQRYRAAQPPGHEAFLPSASSQAHFPPPRM